jgi:hypothetical protein
MLAFALAVVVAVSPKSELHVVAVYESTIRVQGRIVAQPVVVVVNRPGKDVTLVLSAYEATRWDLVVGKGSNVTKVILGGSKKQKADVPEGVEVVEMFGEGREGKESVYAYHNMKSGQLRHSVQSVHKLTKQEISSYQGTYNYDGAKPFFVDMVRNDERLRSDYPRVTPSQDLPKVSFQAAHVTVTEHGQFSGSFGDFTQVGPDKNSLKPLPKGVAALTFDPVGKQYYAVKGHEFHAVDLAKVTTEKLDPGPLLPRVSWPCGTTFDTKRDRVVWATLGGVGQLYTYTPKTGVWAVPTDLNNVDLSALAYHAKDDTLYGLAGARGGDEGGVPVLYAYNALGAMPEQTSLEGPMFPGVLKRGPSETRVQMVSTGDHLAVLVTGSKPHVEGGRRAQTESFLFLIDPKTAKVQLAWKE